MSPKKNPRSETQDSDRTKILIAVISLVSTFIVAYFGYRQVVDAGKNNQPAPINTISVSSTNTPSIILTEVIPPTFTPSATTEVLLTPTPQLLITPECLFAKIWFYFPRKTEPTDKGCWKITEFTPTENGIEIAKITTFDSGEQQRGFYTLLSRDADVQFTVKMHALGEQTISPNLTEVSNLAFGIVEGSSFNYSGIYLYYYASKPGAGTYRSQVTREQSPSYNGVLDIEREQKIRFLIQGNRLTVYIDEIPVGRSYTLDFKQNAFYFGYRLLENTELSVSVSKLSFAP